MSFFDNLENQAISSLMGNPSGSLAAGILQMIQNQPGGLHGLLESFRSKGLGDLVSAWVSNGPNPPATTEQVHEVLGSDRIQQLATAAGISPEMAGPAIAHLLPTVIDKLTPDGQVPDHGNLLAMASKVLGSLQPAKAS